MAAGSEPSHGSGRVFDRNIMDTISGEGSTSGSDNGYIFVKLVGFGKSLLLLKQSLAQSFKKRSVGSKCARMVRNLCRAG